MADEDYFLPLEDQRVFGAGIKRKRIAFVAASDNDAGVTPSLPRSPATDDNVADRYLSIVLKESKPATPTAQKALSSGDVCAICKQPLSPSHESTLAHQVCLEHSHPPSHLDRNRHGLRYLSLYGWNPDERVGLGANAEGIRYPIRPKAKHDTVGLQETKSVEEEAAKVKTKKIVLRKEDKKVFMNAKEVRKQEQEAKKRAEKLRNMFYGSDEVEKYLGTG